MARRRLVSGVTLVPFFACLLWVSPSYAQPPSIDEGAQFIVFTGANRDLAVADFIANGMRSVGFEDVRSEADASGQWLIGLHAGVHIGRFVLGFTEVLYNELGESSASGRVGASTTLPRITIAAETRLVEWTGGLHVQVPVGTWRVRPYLGGGAG
jgi:hypothetical protein